MTNQQTPTQSPAQIVDEIGALKAEIAPLTEKLEALEAALKAHGVGEHAGELFEAKVFEQERSNLDMKAVREKLTPQFIRAHTTTKTVIVLKVTARKLHLNVAA